MNILILGCSFSMGSWSLDTSIPEGERVDKTWCWYDDLPKDNTYDVWATPGGGYVNHLSVLSKTNTKYDQCIIQETFEPRLRTYQVEHPWKTYERNNVTVHIRGTDPYPTHTKTDFLSSVNVCNRILQRNSTPAHAFSFTGRLLSHDWIKYLDMPNVVDTCFYNPKLHCHTDDFEGHLTKEGNLIISKAIQTALKL